MLSKRADPFQTPSTLSGSASTAVATSLEDHTPLSAAGTFVIKLYAFGGLAFMLGVISSAFFYWLWIVVIRRKHATSPPDLEVYPERLVQSKKEAQEKGVDKFTPPPFRFYQRDRRPSLPSFFASPRTARKFSAPMAQTTGRKSSISSSSLQSKGKRVSWASSNSTLDGRGKTSKKPSSNLSTIPPTTDPDFPSQATPPNEMPSPVPEAHTAIRRVTAAIDPRAPRGRAMIATTTPDVVESWSRPESLFAACDCGVPVDPLDITRPHRCPVHRD